MGCIMKSLLAGWLAVALMVGSLGVAHAAFTDVASNNVDGYIGSAAAAGSCSDGTSASEVACDTAGGEWTTATGATGAYELRSVVAVGLGVCIVIALSFAGYHLVRRLFMRAQAA